LGDFRGLASEPDTFVSCCRVLREGRWTAALICGKPYCGSRILSRNIKPWSQGDAMKQLFPVVLALIPFSAVVSAVLMYP